MKVLILMSKNNFNFCKLLSLLLLFYLLLIVFNICNQINYFTCFVDFFLLIFKRTD